LFADRHSILARWKNHFSQLLNVHGVNDVRQREIHTAEPLLSQPSASEVELVIEKQKSLKSPGLIISQQRVEQFALRSVNLLILFGIGRNCMSGRSRSLYLSIRRLIKQIVVIIEAYRFCQLHAKLYPTPFCQG